MLPRIILENLQSIDPDAQFTGNLPKVQSSTGQTYFVKSGSPSESEQYLGEARSLEAIGTAAPGLAPAMIAYGNGEDGTPFFVSEYKDMAPLSSGASDLLAKRLATELHQYKSHEGFGFEVPTFCGATRQRNGWYTTWEQCYSNLIGNLLDGLSRREYSALVTKGEKIREEVIPRLLGKLEIEPVLLHGDLWSGNVGVDSLTGKPVIFDPSSYYGHNEADLAIARIFGGFSQSFFESYHNHHPKSEPVSEYNLRADLYELYHYLNHTLLFGGGYARSAERIMNKLLSDMSNL
ncbi:hypothetical protein AGABI2DRAFT_196782 [Agaricus bisporus var. bisporus H97]|uniref:hypothetical protein n=1 Tax=Agaricus bisporus var. bisporus (strain H97 / ATCC MYA-4626 / FGSC 10389) TaxID=936046 RepID=UPI00029F7A30|nr:hypothetical protein AGABI2DRAFT_196782 [Agaricus bisporus var. bisporus H97]EKV51081.1 hypothetical protein AGABI2DRAFT_196782 [Agaricus bisporus var. bisporus H97]